jgi:hypothetical protein
VIGPVIHTPVGNSNTQGTSSVKVAYIGYDVTSPVE